MIQIGKFSGEPPAPSVRATDQIVSAPPEPCPYAAELDRYEKEAATPTNIKAKRVEAGRRLLGPWARALGMAKFDPVLLVDLIKAIGRERVVFVNGTSGVVGFADGRQIRLSEVTRAGG